MGSVYVGAIHWTKRVRRMSSKKGNSDMKKSTIICAVLCVGFALQANSAIITGTNLLVNPGFENSDISDWGVWRPGGSGLTAGASRTIGSPYSGSRHLYFGDNGSGTTSKARVVLSQWISLGDNDSEDLSHLWGKEFTFSVWGKVSATNANPQMNLQVDLHNSTTKGGGSPPSTRTAILRSGDLAYDGNDVYQQFTFSGTISNGVKGVDIKVDIKRNDSGALDYYLDDASFTVIPEPATLGLIALASTSLLVVRRFMAL